MIVKHLTLLGLLAATVAGCGLEPMEMPTPDAPQALAREDRYPATLRNSGFVPFKYDRRGRIGRLSLDFDVRFAGVFKDKTGVWEINGGEAITEGFNSDLFPARDGYLYVSDRHGEEETLYRVGRFDTSRPLKVGNPVGYQMDFPFFKWSRGAASLMHGLIATSVSFRMAVPETLASHQEPAFYYAYNAGRENTLTPDELGRLGPLLAP